METLEDVKRKYRNASQETMLMDLYKKDIRIAELEELQYGKKSEKNGSKSVLYQSRGMFDEAELNQEPSDDKSSEGQNSEIGSTMPDDSPKPPRKRKPKKYCLENLPKEIEINDLPEDEKFDENGKPLRQIGTDIKKIIEITPAKIILREIHTPKYAKDIDSSEGISTEIISAAKEPSIIPKSPASPSLLAYIITRKYMDAMPLYRQQLMFQRYGLELNRNTMANWVIKSADNFMPLHNLMNEDILSGPAIHCDETRTQTLIEPNKTAESQSYMWCLGRNVGISAVTFHYSPYRNKAAAFDLLNDYTGYVTCDGYSVYESIAKQIDITLTGCFAHVRRKFESARKVAKKNGMKEPDIQAIQALSIIALLYVIESEIKELPPDEKYKIRQEKSKPIVEKLKIWLDLRSLTVLPSSPTGKAISYALGQWDKLVVFLEDGHVAIDNNFIERRIRPFTIGRNNWVFSVSQDGAKASAMFYSFVESAKLNGICPYDYLKIVFKELAKENNMESLEKLLPYNISQHFNVKKLSKPHE